MTRAVICALLVGMVGISVGTERVLAQAARAAIGTGVGVAGGAVITISVIVARARFQNEYMDAAEDLIHWQSLPMILTPAVGLAFGLAGKDPLRGSVIGSTTGMVVGTAIGAGVGWLSSSDPEAPWAGGAMGAGLGMAAGGLYLGIREWLRTKEDDDPDSSGAPVHLGVRIPL